MTNVITTNTSNSENLDKYQTATARTEYIYQHYQSASGETNCENSLKQPLISTDCQTVFFFQKLMVYTSWRKFLEKKLGFICSKTIWMKRRVVANLSQSEFYLNRNSNWHSALAFEREGLTPRSAVPCLNWYKFSEITRLTE